MMDTTSLQDTQALMLLHALDIWQDFILLPLFQDGCIVQLRSRTLVTSYTQELFIESDQSHIKPLSGPLTALKTHIPSFHGIESGS